ncbi:DUF11 domain-containing protein [Bacillus sp. JCM 19034]|uniref:DUF11 domain-containing protein n=1 Tax=Bacillus sp. JCM 19034 TaxID=1481928 RepID=UPI000785B5E8|nr:DUF11 domain-containing protein [Bacillus sp. JCM 19034]
MIELWNAQVDHIEYTAHGEQVAELNANEVGTLYQDVQTNPGQTIYWRLAHAGKFGPDTMNLKIGSPDVSVDNLPIVREITDDRYEWGYYQGEYTVPAGQTVTRFAFESVSAAGNNQSHGNILDAIFLGTEPCVVTNKVVSPEGEVFAGQELTYEVNVKNEGGDIAANTIFEDAIPEGTEYVPGSLKIIDGPGTGDLSDEADDDAGEFDGEKVIIDLGDLPNTNDLPDGITVQFKVKALDTDSEREVTNKAQIVYDNLLGETTEVIETNEVTNTVLPRVEIDACARPVALINGSFEEPPARMPGDTGSPGAEQYWMYFYEDEVPGWQTNASDKFIQIMKNEYIYQYEINPPHGNQYAELNAHQVSALYQDVETIPGQTIYWRLAHRGLLGVDTMTIQIGSADVVAEDLPVIQEISTGTSEWVYYSGTYTVPAGQTTTRFAFNSVDAAGGSQMFGNLLDDIFLGTEPCVVAQKQSHQMARYTLVMN